MLMIQKQMIGCLEVDVGEALALLLGLKCAIDRGIISTDLESDNKSIVDKVMNSVDDRSDAAVFLR